MTEQAALAHEGWGTATLPGAEPRRPSGLSSVRVAARFAAGLKNGTPNVHLPHNAVVVVADGSKLNLYRNTDPQGGLSLHALPPAALEAHKGGSGGRHHDSSANPSHGQGAEDDFAASVAAYLNTEVAGGALQHIAVIAAPRTLGELRKHFSKPVSSAIVGELAKDLTGHASKDVEAAIQAA